MGTQSWMATVVFLSLAGCGGSPVLGTPYLPVAVGNEWVYEEVGGTEPGTVTKTVTETETILDQTTYVVRTTQTNSAVTKRSNWLLDDQRVLRIRQERLDSAGALLNYREYDPGFLRMSGALDEVGETLEEQHTRIELDAHSTQTGSATKFYTWTVQAIDEEVTVAAGTFTCIRLHRVDADSGEKTYWYAAGIGKILESDNVEQERLLEYTISSD